MDDVVGVDDELGVLGDGGVWVCGERVCEPFGVYGVVCVVASCVSCGWSVDVVGGRVGRDVQLPDSFTTSSFCGGGQRVTVGGGLTGVSQRRRATLTVRVIVFGGGGE